MAENGGESEERVMRVAEKEKSTDTQDAIRKLKAKLLPGMKYTLLFSLALYLAVLIIGILAVKNCPVNENIPLFLCIIGFVGLSSKLVTYLRDRIIPYFRIKYVETALYTTEFVFTILGTYWVFSEYKPSFNPMDGSKYCQKTGYMVAFIYLAIIYALIIAFILLAVCVCCCACLGIGILNKLIEHDIEKYESQVPYIDEEVKENSDGQK